MKVSLKSTDSRKDTGTASPIQQGVRDPGSSLHLRQTHSVHRRSDSQSSGRSGTPVDGWSHSSQITSQEAEDFRPADSSLPQAGSERNGHAGPQARSQNSSQVQSPQPPRETPLLESSPQPKLSNQATEAGKESSPSIELEESVPFVVGDDKPLENVSESRMERNEARQRTRPIKRKAPNLNFDSQDAVAEDPADTMRRERREFFTMRNNQSPKRPRLLTDDERLSPRHPPTPAAIGHASSQQELLQPPSDDIFVRFISAYQDYDEGRRHFEKMCHEIASLGKGLHKSLWDDYVVRSVTDYDDTLGQSYRDFYDDHVDEPKYMKRVLTPETLRVLLVDSRNRRTSRTSTSSLRSSQQASNRASVQVAQSVFHSSPPQSHSNLHHMDKSVSHQSDRTVPQRTSARVDTDFQPSFTSSGQSKQG